MSFVYGRPKRELLESLDSVDLSELVAADRLGLIPDWPRLVEEVSKRNWQTVYELHKATYGYGQRR